MTTTTLNRTGEALTAMANLLGGYHEVRDLVTTTYQALVRRTLEEAETWGRAAELLGWAAVLAEVLERVDQLPPSQDAPEGRPDLAACRMMVNSMATCGPELRRILLDALLERLGPGGADELERRGIITRTDNGPRDRARALVRAIRIADDHAAKAHLGDLAAEQASEWAVAAWIARSAHVPGIGSGHRQDDEVVRPLLAADEALAAIRAELGDYDRYPTVAEAGS